MSGKRLLRQILEKLEEMFEDNPKAFKPLVADLGRVMRMGWDIVRGRFNARPAQIAVIVGALTYVFFPFDVVPDMIPFAGLVDDAAVLTAAMLKLSDLMKQWEGETNGC